MEHGPDGYTARCVCAQASRGRHTCLGAARCSACRLRGRRHSRARRNARAAAGRERGRHSARGRGDGRCLVLGAARADRGLRIGGLRHAALGAVAVRASGSRAACMAVTCRRRPCAFADQPHRHLRGRRQPSSRRRGATAHPAGRSDLGAPCNEAGVGPSHRAAGPGLVHDRLSPSPNACRRSRPCPTSVVVVRAAVAASHAADHRRRRRVRGNRAACAERPGWLRRAAPRRPQRCVDAARPAHCLERAGAGRRCPGRATATRGRAAAGPGSRLVASCRRFRAFRGPRPVQRGERPDRCRPDAGRADDVDRRALRQLRGRGRTPRWQRLDRRRARCGRKLVRRRACGLPGRANRAARCLAGGRGGAGRAAGGRPDARALRPRRDGARSGGHAREWSGARRRRGAGHPRRPAPDTESEHVRRPADRSSPCRLARACR